MRSTKVKSCQLQEEWPYHVSSKQGHLRVKEGVMTWYAGTVLGTLGHRLPYLQVSVRPMWVLKSYTFPWLRKHSPKSIKISSSPSCGPSPFFRMCSSHEKYPTPIARSLPSSLAISISWWVLWFVMLMVAHPPGREHCSHLSLPTSWVTDWVAQVFKKPFYSICHFVILSLSVPLNCWFRSPIVCSSSPVPLGEWPNCCVYLSCLWLLDPFEEIIIFLSWPIGIEAFLGEGALL